MNHLKSISQIWHKLYDKNQDTEPLIENFFHQDYTQCINGVIMNRDEYIDHVVEQKKNIESMKFTIQNHLMQSSELFVLYYAKGTNIEGNEIEAEVIAYFEFKDNKVFYIHGQVRLLKGNASDVDIHD